MLLRSSLDEAFICFFRPKEDEQMLQLSIGQFVHCKPLRGALPRRVSTEEVRILQAEEKHHDCVKANHTDRVLFTHHADSSKTRETFRRRLQRLHDLLTCGTHIYFLHASEYSPENHWTYDGEKMSINTGSQLASLADYLDDEMSERFTILAYDAAREFKELTHRRITVISMHQSFANFVEFAEAISIDISIRFKNINSFFI